MDEDLVDEIEYLIELLTKSGFFSLDEIMEILDDQFIEEEIDFSGYDISLNDFSNENFSKLENAFAKLAERTSSQSTIADSTLRKVWPMHLN